MIAAARVLALFNDVAALYGWNLDRDAGIPYVTLFDAGTVTPYRWRLEVIDGGQRRDLTCGSAKTTLDFLSYLQGILDAHRLTHPKTSGFRAAPRTADVEARDPAYVLEQVIPIITNDGYTDNDRMASLYVVLPVMRAAIGEGQ